MLLYEYVYYMHVVPRYTPQKYCTVYELSWMN